MLVLSRMVGEKILIGDDIEVKVVKIDGEKVRLGIVAPIDMPVHRQEVWVRIKEMESADESS